LIGPAEALLLFLRDPQPGRVKTRLISLLGPEGAAAVYCRMATAVIREVEGLRRPGLLRAAFVDPPGSLFAVRSWLGPSYRLLPQAAGDLGRRLAASFEWAFGEGALRAVALGTDCLDLNADLLAEAFDALASSDAVVGPAADGGYYLIGLARSLAPRLETVFGDVPWSTERVKAVTLERLREMKAGVRLLPELRDLDTPEDYQALLPRWGSVLGEGG
jgi:hypothetical protein